MTRSQTGANEYSSYKEFETPTAGIAYERTHEILREEYSKLKSLKQKTNLRFAEKRATSIDEHTEFQVTQTYQTPMTFGEASKFTPYRMKDSTLP